MLLYLALGSDLAQQEIALQDVICSCSGTEWRPLLGEMVSSDDAVVRKPDGQPAGSDSLSEKGIHSKEQFPF